VIFDRLTAAEHWIHAQDPVPAVAGTLFAPPHVRVILEAAPGARAVRFPGVDRLVGSLPVSAVSRFVRMALLGGGAVGPATVLDTRDFVRPLWNEDLEPVLTVMPAGDGIVVPFETRHPTPCCAAH
jgi:hypothetical protein